MFQKVLHMAKAKKSLVEIHEDVPADHYDKALKRNLFQIYWHNKRFREVLKETRPTKGAVLDVGCHGGTFTQVLLKRIKTNKIYGVDISPSAIKLIKKKIPYGKFQVADATKLPYKQNFFDQIYCLEVLEHVDKPQQIVKEMKRVLKKNGRGIILVPTNNTLFRFMWFLWTLYYPVWRHAHVNNFDGKKLEALLTSAKLKILHTKEFNLGMLKLIVFSR